ncbi:MAG TPA: 5-oxoprolinase subunit PxpB [Bacillota bacterium]
MNVRVRCLPAGDQALYLCIEPARIDPAISRRLQLLANALEAQPPRGVREVIPAYSTLQVLYDPLVTDFRRVAAECRARFAELADAPLPPPRRWRLPTLYGGEHGPDLEEVARYHGLSSDEVVRIHAGTDYFIHFMGFAPGFPYLGGLSPRLATPRLATPRTRVPAGSVAIGGAQTGVYPLSTPGGWRLIGRTPVPLCRPDRVPPAVLVPGDYVRFVPIDPATYREIEAEVAAGRYRLEPEALPVRGEAPR